MALTPQDIAEKTIVPNPCGEAETNRNWDAVRNIITNIYETIQNGTGGGTRMAEVELIPDPEVCVKEDVEIVQASWRPLYVEDPANPMVRPTSVKNFRGLGVAEQQIGLRPKGYIVFDPNVESLDRWELVQVDHISVTILSNAEFIAGQGVHFTGVVATVIPCGPAEGEVGVDIETVTARAIYNLGVNNVNGCSLYSNEVEMEVFSTTLDPTDYVEFTFDNVNVITDVYQGTPYGNILGYYYKVYAPCVTLVGEDLLIYVDTCPP